MLVPNHLIRRALYEAVQEADCATLLTGVAVTAVETSPEGGRLTLADGREIRARLVVAADTRLSEARRQMGIATRMRDFGKSMLVARVAHEKPHDGVATEWFGHGQTVAMLPLNSGAAIDALGASASDDRSAQGDVSSIVLTLSARQIDALMHLTPEEFGADSTRRTKARRGVMRLVGTRHAYPLVTTYAMRFVGTRFALIGDAAVGMHPVTAHGFNFGLAGAERLATQLRGDEHHRKPLHRRPRAGTRTARRGAAARRGARARRRLVTAQLMEARQRRRRYSTLMLFARMTSA